MHLHTDPKEHAAMCPRPCAPCHTAVEGEKCYNSVIWSIKQGVIHHPNWFKGLTKDSSFEAFQSHLYWDPNSTASCPEPCPPSEHQDAPAVKSVPAPDAGSEKCHTAVKGEKCHSSVQWVMNEGIKKHPKWFKGLSATSSFVDVQVHLHEDPQSTASCPLPCQIQLKK